MYKLHVDQLYIYLYIYVLTQLHDKEARLRELESHEMTEEHKAYFQDQQIEDRLRHYEAQAQLVETLQRELNSAQDTVNALTNQNTVLQGRLSTEQEKRTNGGEGDSRIEHMSSSLQQLEMERDQLMKQLDQEQDLHADVKSQLHKLQTELATQGMFTKFAIWSYIYSYCFIIKAIFFT